MAIKNETILLNIKHFSMSFSFNLPPQPWLAFFISFKLFRDYFLLSYLEIRLIPGLVICMLLIMIVIRWKLDKYTSSELGFVIRKGYVCKTINAYPLQIYNWRKVIHTKEHLHHSWHFSCLVEELSRAGPSDVVGVLMQIQVSTKDGTKTVEQTLCTSIGLLHVH